MWNAEQVVASQQAQAQNAFDLTQKTFESLEKLWALNLSAAKAALNETAEQAQAALQVKDPQDWLNTQANALQPAVEKATAYSRHVYGITSDTAAQWIQAIEDNVEQAQQRIESAVESFAKNAPAGTEPFVALVKSTLAANQQAWQAAQKAWHQASEAAEANFNAVANTATNTAAKATGAKKRS